MNEANSLKAERGEPHAPNSAGSSPAWLHARAVLAKSEGYWPCLQRLTRPFFESLLIFPIFTSFLPPSVVGGNTPRNSSDSFNGRTLGFDPRDGGSTPSFGAKWVFLTVLFPLKNELIKLEVKKKRARTNGKGCMSELRRGA